MTINPGPISKFRISCSKRYQFAPRSGVPYLIRIPKHPKEPSPKFLNPNPKLQAGALPGIRGVGVVF